MQTLIRPLPCRSHSRQRVRNRRLMRTVCYLSAALVLTDAFAQDDSKPKVLEIETIGARVFGGTAVPMPDDPTNFQACDHGFVEWFIPTQAREHPMVLVHGSSTRTYQTTFDGKPGFQSLLLDERYPVYLVDLPWTERAGKACSDTRGVPLTTPSRHGSFFTNRVGLWAPGRRLPTQIRHLRRARLFLLNRPSRGGRVCLRRSHDLSEILRGFRREMHFNSRCDSIGITKNR
jgi:hypothetical protein